MSFLFYRRPDYLAKSEKPINATDHQKYLERARNARNAIPSGLSFEKVMKGKTLPPCSLGDFMDYLVYVEFNAENLQFYLWYKNYVRRFNALPDEEKDLSPTWVPEVKLPPKSEDQKEEKTEGESASLEDHDTKEVCGFGDDDIPSSPLARPASLAIHRVTSSMTTASYASSTADGSTRTNLKWQPSELQPMRDELNRVMRHYLAFSAPRELNLTHKDRAQCLHALQHTTHPSALAPAARVAEAYLRGQSHPNFIRWSICNGNRSRIIFGRTMAISNISLGFAIGILISLSSASRWWRLFAAVEWFVGISTMVATYKGLCLVLHRTHARNLRPWEQEADLENCELRKHSFASSANQTIQQTDQTSDCDFTDRLGEKSKFKNSKFQPFGPHNNNFEGDAWVEKYEKKSFVNKVFDESVWTQDDDLKLLQDKIVMGANLWALILTIPLTVLVLALPKGNLY